MRLEILNTVGVVLDVDEHGVVFDVLVLNAVVIVPASK